jgi:uncharacterized protein YggE
MRSLILVLAIITLDISHSAMHAQQIDTRRTVSVEGVAEVTMKPDRASITLGVETDGKDAGTVKRDNDKAMRAILNALTTAGIEDKDIQTSNLTLQPIYNWKPDGKREFVKYTMSNTIHVTVRDLSKLDRVLDEAVGVGGNVVNSIDFDVSNANAVRDSLRAAAASNAKTKATQMAQAVGARVGKVLTLSEEYSAPPTPVFAKGARMMAMAMDDSSAPTVSAGQMIVRVSVTAMFELE